MRTIEYKFARLEELNGALRRKLRHCENEISRLSVRESQMKDARRLPLLQQRLDASLKNCEELECQLAETRGRESKLADEVNVLRTFVRLSENPTLAETARQEVEHKRLLEDSLALGEQLRLLATERDEYKKRAVLSCEEAEYYRDKWSASFEEKRRLEEYMRGLIAAQPATSPATSIETNNQTASPASDDLRRARECLQEEQARSEALRETIDALYAEKKMWRRSQSRGRRLSSPAREEEDEPTVSSSEGNRKAEGGADALRQQLRLAEGECALLRTRWNALREQNQSLLERTAELERAEAMARGQLQSMTGECDRLRRQLEIFVQAKTFMSSPLAGHSRPDNEEERGKEMEEEATHI